MFKSRLVAFKYLKRLKSFQIMQIRSKHKIPDHLKDIPEQTDPKFSQVFHGYTI